MSQENVEIVEQMVEAFNRRDLDHLEARSTPDMEWETAMGAIEAEVFKGFDGAETYIERLGDAWGEFQTIAEDVRDVGERVLMLGRIVGRGKGSGVGVEMPLGQVFDFRDGKVCRIRSYLDHGEALRALGLGQ
jgi:ketosteroid isomerase-like protein